MSNALTGRRETFTVLTIVFAALPATIMSLFAGLGVVLGISALFSGSASGMVFALWGGGGLFATVALWAAVVHHFRHWVLVGLVTGVLCFAPVTISFAGQFLRGPLFDVSYSAMDYLLLLLSVSLPLIAIGWIVYIMRRLKTARSSATGQ